MYRLIAPLTLFCLAPQSLQRVKSTPPRARVFGKIVGEDGRGIAPSRVFLVSWPLRHSSVGSVDRIEVTTRQLGRFEARLLEGRAYTVWGQIKDEKGTSMTNVIEAATAGRPLRLSRASRWQRPRGQVTGRELWASTTLELCVVASTRNVVEAKLTLSKEGIAIIPPMPGRRGYLTIRNKDGLHVALKSVDFSNGKTVVVNLAKPLLVDLMVTSKATGKPPRQQYLLVGAPGHAATYVFFGGPDRKRDLRVALDSGSSLSGRVLRPDGKAATGAQLLIVTMVRAAGNPGGHWGVPPIPVTCGKDGRFEFHGLTRRNNFHVLALTPGLGLSKQMTNPVHWLLAHAPATDEKTDLGDLELARLSKLELRVQHADGSPATAARVHQHDRRLSVWIDHVVDSRGKLSMLCPATELAFGAYELRGGVGLARWTLVHVAVSRPQRASWPG